MSQSAAPLAPLLPAAPPPPPGRGPRLLHGLLAPVRFARRRPGRSALLFGTLLTALGATAATALWGWLGYNLRLARGEVERGHNAAATRYLASCRWVQPEHPEVLILAARVARRSGAWDEAEALLDRYWQRYGDDDRLAFERLLLRTTRGDVEATGPALLARVQQGGADAFLAREALITGLTYRYLWLEARREIDAWLAAAPDSTIALLLRGKLQEQRLQTSEAMLSYRAVLALDPRHDEARLRLTTLLLQIRQGEEAVAHLAYLRQSLPQNPEVHTQWVRALALQGKADEARAALDDCLRAHPNYPAALAERGRFAMTAGDDRTAEGCLGRSLQFDPGNIATRHQYAQVLKRNGKPADAARELERIRQLEADVERINRLISDPLQRDPNNPAVHHEIGMIALRAGQPVEALRWFRSALQVGPEHTPTHQILAAYYHEVGNPILAARHRAIAHRLSGLKGP